MAKKSLVAIAKGEDIQANVTKVFYFMIKSIYYITTRPAFTRPLFL